ncbi:uncharacterized protein [Typha angustifolia]|uniref:uncharacterized protein isoform X2 n=1 Tax=Typha angustifolia TaxID=59011 RepID=UPI003C2D336E
MEATPNSSFPSTDELSAATALLLLLFPSPPSSNFKPSLPSSSSSFSTRSLSEEDSSSCISDSCSSSSNPLRILAVVASLRRIDPKIARSMIQKNKTEETTTELSVESEESAVSSLSTASSGYAHAPVRTRGGVTKKPKSARLRRRADAILKFLSSGSSSEAKIREVIGNRPDTSKALRMLLKQEEVTRSGAGGRVDPFLYTISIALLSKKKKKLQRAEVWCYEQLKPPYWGFQFPKLAKGMASKLRSIRWIEVAF